VSVALGELLSLELSERLRQLRCCDGFSFRFAKVGLAGCGPLRDWQSRWRGFAQSLPPCTLPVAVAYADWQHAVAPRPEEVLALAIQEGCRGLLVDTHYKSHGSLLNHMPLAEIERVVERARGHGMVTVLAGSLNADTLRRVLTYAPSFIAVRGAACCGTRTGELDELLVRELAWVVARGERRSQLPVRACNPGAP
jgi:hypothetical protein